MSRLSFRFLFVLAVVFQLNVFAALAHASSIEYTASSGSRAASALFDLEGNILTITLSNLSLADVGVPTDVLTGLFFNTVQSLTPVSASLGGSTVYYGSLSDVGDGWGFVSGVDAQGLNSAISASGAVSGLGSSNFSSTHKKLKGLDYGLLSQGDDSSTGNTGVTGKGPLVKSSVVFTLVAAQGFSLSELGDSVVFQYGTDLSEPFLTGNASPHATNPEPGTMLLMGLGAAGVGFARRWSRKEG